MRFSFLSFWRPRLGSALTAASVCIGLLPSLAAADCNPDQAYLGQVCMMGYGRPACPSNTLPADGRLLAISQYDALFYLLGTTYGGDGQTTFALPNLSSRIPIGQGTRRSDGRTITLGETWGAETRTLYTGNMPAHGHALQSALVANSTAGTAALPSAQNNALAGMAAQELTGSGVVAAARWAAPEGDSAKTIAVAGLTSTLAATGGNQAFDMQTPSLGLLYCVVVAGIFPSQN